MLQLAYHFKKDRKEVSVSIKTKNLVDLGINTRVSNNTRVELILGANEAESTGDATLLINDVFLGRLVETEPGSRRFKEIDAGLKFKFVDDKGLVYLVRDANQDLNSNEVRICYRWNKKCKLQCLRFIRLRHLNT